MSKLRTKTVGLLALQGDYAMHREIVEALGHRVREVRTVAALDGLDALIMPGGETTTMRKLMVAEGFFDAIREFSQTRPVLGTCAGLILLGMQMGDGEDDLTLELLDCDVDRNAYGRQLQSFRDVGEVDFGEGRHPVEMVFIRAPKITRVGETVKVLGWLNGGPTLVRQGNILGATFHPELSGDGEIHRYFLTEMSCGAVVEIDRGVEQRLV